MAGKFFFVLSVSPPIEPKSSAMKVAYAFYGPIYTSWELNESRCRRCSMIISIIRAYKIDNRTQKCSHRQFNGDKWKLFSHKSSVNDESESNFREHRSQHVTICHFSSSFGNQRCLLKIESLMHENSIHFYDCSFENLDWRYCAMKISSPSHGNLCSSSDSLLVCWLSKIPSMIQWIAAIIVKSGKLLTRFSYAWNFELSTFIYWKYEFLWRVGNAFLLRFYGFDSRFRSQSNLNNSIEIS